LGQEEQSNCGVEWRRLHNEELRDMYSLPNIIRLLESRGMEVTGHVARIG